MINKGSHLILYSHNQNVRGDERSVIYNFKKGTLCFIPNSLNDLLEEFSSRPVAAVRAELEGEDCETFDEYVSYLRENQLAFYTDEPHAFPRMDKAYFVPEHISNCVLEFNLEADYTNFSWQLDETLCKNLEIRVPGDHNILIKLDVFLTGLSTSTLRSIAIYLEDYKGLEISALKQLYQNYPKIDKIIILGYQGKVPNIESEDISFFAEEPSSVYSRPFPLDKYLVNRKFFLLSSNHHPYFFKRIEIDHIGNVKNCLLHQESFGNIFEQPLGEIIEKKEFRKWWDISNDNIEDFKDNELRYALFPQNPLILSHKGTYQLEAF
ncbi:hypothetical protein GJU39_00180 [Pedobacter petrophilus]|uniref:4Fe4S-binding SPASM domain-containing protein n=1 Tax=Pedobacter petrophilus TaxID=1908241 RepID=A0A7K0FSA0_9SPHI|nr:SPASM domain-containing protein [Pedobacter petrophilus]MRX74488.1 hypothetical protein [Pedobacter petrophilus]